MAEQKDVKEPKIEVSTSHIRPFMAEKWENRAPTDEELACIATTICSLEGYERKYEFNFGYDAYVMTIKNAKNKDYMDTWLNPQSPEDALDDTKDISEKVSLIGNDGPDFNKKHEVNLMAGSPRLVEKYEEMLKEVREDILFVVITDVDKYGASSSTSRGDKLANIDMVEIIPEYELEAKSFFKNNTLDDFINE